jgi:hypothetical protein
MPDASFFDASFPDSGPFDAGVRDAGAFDAGPINYCAPTTGAVGASCLADADCMFVGQFCVLSSAYQDLDSGAVGPASGFCTQLCTPTSLCPTGSTCVQLTPTSHGASNVSLCLVDVTQSKTDPLQLAPLQCQREGDCLDFPGLTCTVFDSSALPDAVSFCDTAVPGGVNNGAACHRSSKPFAANGLCLPQGAVTGEADAVCTTSADCEVGNCLVSEFLTGAVSPINGFPIVRAVGACYSKPPSMCAACAAATDCSADAPHCVGTDAGICRMACTSSSSCPSGHTCDDAGYCGCP